MRNIMIHIVVDLCWAVRTGFRKISATGLLRASGMHRVYLQNQHAWAQACRVSGISRRDAGLLCASAVLGTLSASAAASWRCSLLSCKRHGRQKGRKWGARTGWRREGLGRAPRTPWASSLAMLSCPKQAWCTRIGMWNSLQ